MGLGEFLVAPDDLRVQVVRRDASENERREPAREVLLGEQDGDLVGRDLAVERDGAGEREEVAGRADEKDVGEHHRRAHREKALLRVGGVGADPQLGPEEHTQTEREHLDGPREPLDLALPDDVDVYDGDATTVDTGTDDDR